MRRFRRPAAIAVLLATLLLSVTAHADGRPVRLSGLDANLAGPRAQVLVLGSLHLDQVAEFDPVALEPLLDRLAGFRPDLITVEAMRGEDCQRMALYPDRYWPESIAHFCADTTAGRAATGLDVPAASAAAERLLAGWPATPDASMRRRLASLFLAAGDRTSATVQWLQLPVMERHAGDGLDGTLVEILESSRVRRGENQQIAAVLAARLGLQRVYPVDDHTGDALRLSRDEVPAYGKALSEAWEAAADATAADQERLDTLLASGDLLAVYRGINRPDALQARVEADVAAALADPSPRHYGQRYVAAWETRNLRMVANIRETFRDHPGARVLSIVGATHKPWFDGLLGQMQGVDIVEAETVLGISPSAATAPRAPRPPRLPAPPGR